MSRLYWKELREQQWYIILWIIATLVTGLTGKAQTLLGNATTVSFWFIVPTMLALFTGMRGYGNETKGGRNDFLFALRVQRWQVLGVKISLGLGVALLAPLLTALLWRLFFCAPEYHAVASFPELTLNALSAGGLLAIAYLLGLSASVAWPGIAGATSVLVFCFACIGFILIGLLSYPNTPIFKAPIGFALSIIPAIILAGMITAIHGITLNREARLLRFLSLTGALLIIGILMDLHIPGRQAFSAKLYYPCYSHINISPDQAYAYFVSYQRVFLLDSIIANPTNNGIGYQSLSSKTASFAPESQVAYYNTPMSASPYFWGIGHRYIIPGTKHIMQVSPQGWQLIIDRNNPYRGNFSGDYNIGNYHKWQLIISDIGFDSSEIKRQSAVLSPDGRCLAFTDAKYVYIYNCVTNKCQKYKSNFESNDLYTLYLAWVANDTLKICNDLNPANVRTQIVKIH